MASALSQIVAVAPALPVLEVDSAVLPSSSSPAERRSASAAARPEPEPVVASGEPDAQGSATPRPNVPPAVSLLHQPSAEDDMAHPRRDMAPLRLAIPSEDEDQQQQQQADEDSPPTTDDPALELCFDGELSIVERVYLFANSNSVFHRLYIARELPTLLPDAPPGDAVIYILPLLNPLATDIDAVKEVLVTGIVDIIWWFFTHCEVVAEDIPEGEHDPPIISVMSFTPLLGSLLMNPHTTVGSSARAAVVELLNRLHSPKWWPVGDSKILDAPTRKLIEAELVYEVIVGLGRLEYVDRAQADEAERAQPLANVPSGPTAAVEPDVSSMSNAIEAPTPDTQSASVATISNGLDFPTLSPVSESLDELALPDTSGQSQRPRAPTPSSAQPSTASLVDDLLVPIGNSELQDASLEVPPHPASTASDTASTSRTAHRDALSYAASLSTSENDVPAVDDRVASSGSSSPVSRPAVMERPGDALAVIDLTAHVAADNPQTRPVAGASGPGDDTRASTSSTTISRIPSPSRYGAQALPRQPAGASDAEAATPVGPVERIPALESNHTTTLSTPTSPTATASSISQIPDRTPLTTLPGHDLPPHLPFSEAAHAFSRSAPPNHIALPPQGIFRAQNLDLESQTASPPRAPDADANTALALFPGTPFPQAGEARDPMLEYLPGRDQPADWTRVELDEGITSDDVAIGRLSCMSLIATVTTQSVETLSQEVQTCFVEEVARVQDDPEFWVRREATLALGALAKVVPLEVLQTWLLPLFERWLHDTTWNVRQAAIFTLPNILNGLPPAQRRDLALDVLPKFANDDNETVRASVLEVLGEVIYAFIHDPDGPPAEILNLYLGDSSSWAMRSSIDGLWGNDNFFKPVYLSNFSSSSRDPSRELTCAFNFPAVGLTLGKPRWPELRDFYVFLSHSTTHKVRRTIAASLGEVANIIGEENASQDLVPIWRRSVWSDDGEIRLKALDCLPLLLGSLSQQDRDAIAAQLDDIWTNRLRGWREREVLTGHLSKLSSLLGSHWNTVRGLLFRALRDPVAAVRESAIAQVATCFYESGSHLEPMRRELVALAMSNSFRDRHTYTSCCVAVCCDDRAAVCPDDRAVSELDRPEMWQALSRLAHDRIVDVRIGVARAVGSICDLYYKDPRLRPAQAQTLVLQLARDESDVVACFVRHLTNTGSLAKRPPLRSTPSLFATFHDPPPTSTPDPANGHAPLAHEGNGLISPDFALHDAEPLLTPGSTYDLPSSIDWTTNTSLMEESLSQDDNLSDESFGTLDVEWPDGDPFADPPSRPGSPKWFGTP